MMEFGLVGEKLGHSFSPEIHRSLADYSYELCEVSKDKIDSFFEKKEFKGLNVTIPYKQTVIPHLDFISDAAREIGAVNTVLNRDGKLYGYNTDYFGMRNLAEKNGIDMTGKKVLVAGSGGTSKTALYTARQMGASQVFRLSRSTCEDCISYERAYKSCYDAQIIINTTPAGMFPRIDGDGSIALEPERFPDLEGVIDAVFNPLRTNLVIRAQKKGCTAAGGLYMLVAQAAAACEIFTGKAVSSAKTDEIYEKLLTSKENIVLTGMPSCGKTSVGRMVAAELGREFFDCDEQIEKKAGKTVSEIFRESGEKGFRDIESDVIKELSSKTGAVISTGGGAVLRGENITALKHDGIIFFIDRSPEKLICTEDRPLSSDRKSLEKRYRERIDIYRGTCDVSLDGDGTVAEVCAALKKEFFRK